MVGVSSAVGGFLSTYSELLAGGFADTLLMKEIIKGLSQWAEGYAKKATFLASLESDPQQKKDYEGISVVMHNIAHKQPQSFREALQLTLLLHLATVNEDPQSGQSIGRLGQILQPFYAKDLREGKITEEEAIELLELYRVKITSIECFASSGVTGGVLSGNTFNNLGIGGLNHDGMPDKVGCQPFGLDSLPKKSESAAQKPAHQWTLGEAFKTRALWCDIFAFMAWHCLNKKSSKFLSTATA